MKKTLSVPAKILVIIAILWHVLLLFTKKNDVVGGGLDDLVEMEAITSTQKGMYILWYAMLAITAIVLILLMIKADRKLALGVIIAPVVQLIVSFAAGKVEMLGVSETLIPVALPIISIILSAIIFFVSGLAKSDSV